MDFFEQLILNLGAMAGESGNIIILDSKRIGVGKGEGRNLESGQEVYSTGREARDAERLRAAQLNQAIDESGTPQDELDKAEENMIDLLVEEILEKDILGEG